MAPALRGSSGSTEMGRPLFRVSRPPREKLSVAAAVQVVGGAGLGPHRHGPGRDVRLPDPGEQVRVGRGELFADRLLDLLARGLLEHRVDDLVDHVVQAVQRGELLALPFEFAFVVAALDGGREDVRDRLHERDVVRREIVDRGVVRPEDAPRVVARSDDGADAAADVVVREEVGAAEPRLGGEVGDNDGFVDRQGVRGLRVVLDRRHRRRPDDTVVPPDALPEQQLLAVGVELQHLAVVDVERLRDQVGRLRQQPVEVAVPERALAEVRDHRLLADPRTQLTLAFEPLGDVPDDATPTGRLAVVRDRSEAALGRDGLPVAPQEVEFDPGVVALARGDLRRHRLRPWRHLVGVDRRRVGAQQFLAVVPRHPAERVVDQREPRVRVDGVDAVVDGLDDGLVLFEFAFALLALRDVPDDADAVGQADRVAVDECERRLGHQWSPVGGPEFGLEAGGVGRAAGEAPVDVLRLGRRLRVDHVQPAVLEVVADRFDETHRPIIVPATQHDGRQVGLTHRRAHPRAGRQQTIGVSDAAANPQAWFESH